MSSEKDIEKLYKQEQTVSDNKFYEPVVKHVAYDAPRNSIFTLFKEQKLMTLGFTAALVWGVVKWRRRHRRPAHYPLDIFILDMRVQVASLVIFSAIAATFADLFLFKMERRKLRRVVDERKVEISSLAEEGLEEQIKSLPPIYNPFELQERPSYWNRIKYVTGNK